VSEPDSWAATEAWLVSICLVQQALMLVHNIEPTLIDSQCLETDNDGPRFRPGVCRVPPATYLTARGD